MSEIRGSGIDEPIIIIDVEDNNAVYYYHFDGLGSISALTDANGTVVEKYEYDVFGGTTIKNASDNILTESAIGNPYGFTGRRFDPETDNYYYRMRYYNPDIGRFLQTDPPYAYSSMGLYHYCWNNPINWIDPWGLKMLWGQFSEGTSEALSGLVTAGAGGGIMVFSTGVAAPLGGAVMFGVGVPHLQYGYTRARNALIGVEVPPPSASASLIGSATNILSGNWWSTALGIVEIADVMISNFYTVNNIATTILPSMGSTLADPTDIPNPYGMSNKLK